MDNKQDLRVIKLNEIARALTASERGRMSERRRERYWQAASSAIAAKVNRQLRLKGISRTDFAELLGVTPANVTRYLNGKTNLELRTIVEMERVLGIRIINRDVVPTAEKVPATPVCLQIRYDWSECSLPENDFFEVKLSKSGNIDSKKILSIDEYA